MDPGPDDEALRPSSKAVAPQSESMRRLNAALELVGYAYSVSLLIAAIGISIQFHRGKSVFSASGVGRPANSARQQSDGAPSNKHRLTTSDKNDLLTAGLPGGNDKRTPAAFPAAPETARLDSE